MAPLTSRKDSTLVDKHPVRTPVVRPGFSIMELLIVIAVIGILAALTAGGVMKVIASQQQHESERTVHKTVELLKRHWKAVVDDAREESRQSNIGTSLMPLWVTYLAGKTGSFGYDQDASRTTTVWTKLRLRQQFPMTYKEAVLNYSVTIGGKAYTLAPDPAYAKYLNEFNVNVAAPASPAQTAACLLMALTVKSRRGVTVDPHYFTSNETVDTDKDGAPEIVDSWGTPLLLFRFPINTDLDQTNPLKNSPANPFQDPLDPTGRLLDTTWANSGLFATSIHAISNSYIVPVVVSAGQNKVFGLDDGLYNPVTMKMVPSSPQANDNIYSYLITR